MKIKLNSKKRPAGFILLLVMILCAFSLVILVGEMNRTSTVAILNSRSVKLSALNNAAEAATEKVYAKMVWDFGYGPGNVSNNLQAGIYKNMVPTTSDNAYWANFQFSDPSSGTVNNTYVAYLTNYTGPLPTQYTNQFATTSPEYRIVSNVTRSGTMYPDVIGTAQEDVLLALVPITTYAIFYNGELEFSDCATMVVNGRVHSNSDICVGAGSSATLTFNGAVTCCSTLSAPERGGVGPWTSPWATTFNAGYTTNMPSINLSLTMTNTHSIIEIPPGGEDPMSAQGQVRLYNEAQVVLIVTNLPTTVTNLGGVLQTNYNPEVLLTLQTAYNGNLPGSDNAKGLYAISNATPGVLQTNSVVTLPFLSLTNSFYDQRQSQTNFVTQIDVGQYASWLSTNSHATGKFTSGLYPTILYVADRRNVGSIKSAVVRLVNGSKLPYNNDLGFTVATQNPIYVQGDYNIANNYTTAMATNLGSTTNGASVPAAILSDALTLLSSSWSDTLSGNGYGSRNVPPNNYSMTFNAAIVTGNIPSTDITATTFSGGVHNLTRFLENWSGTGVTLYLNTSIVCLFSSQMATKQFQMPGAYYDPPTRKWGFDTTYYSPNKQPPGVPCALVPIRFNWKIPPPGSVTSN